MSQKTDIDRRNSLRLLDRAYRIDVNAIKLNPTNTWEHEFRKVQICWDLLKKGRQFITEAIFVTKGRADIFCLDDCTVIEVLGTETLEQCKQKLWSDKYPIEIEAVASDIRDKFDPDNLITVKFGGCE